jgi:hypothetical protein
MTSAPRSASSCVAQGPAKIRLRSRTRNPVKHAFIFASRDRLDASDGMVEDQGVHVARALYVLMVCKFCARAGYIKFILIPMIIP